MGGAPYGPVKAPVRLHHRSFIVGMDSRSLVAEPPELTEVVVGATLGRYSTGHGFEYTAAVVYVENLLRGTFTHVVALRASLGKTVLLESRKGLANRGPTDSKSVS